VKAGPRGSSGPRSLAPGSTVYTNPEFPDYSDQATRLQAFKYWGGVLPKEELAEAGFYMIAHWDVVRCFSCHVVLQDWEKTENVIEEHRRHSPDCTFLKMLVISQVASPHSSTTINMTVDITLSPSCEPQQISNSSPSNPPSFSPSPQEILTLKKVLQYVDLSLGCWQCIRKWRDYGKLIWKSNTLLGEFWCQPVRCIIFCIGL